MSFIYFWLPGTLYLVFGLDNLNFLFCRHFPLDFSADQAFRANVRSQFHNHNIFTWTILHLHTSLLSGLSLSILAAMSIIVDSEQNGSCSDTSKCVE